MGLGDTPKLGQKEGQNIVFEKMMVELQKNPLEFFQVKLKHVESGFKSWLAKQSLPVEAAVVTALGGVQGAAIGGLMGTLSADIPKPSGAESSAMAAFSQAQSLAGGPLVQARNIAVITGVNAGITSIMKRIRGKEDLESSVVAAIGSGAMFSLVSTGLQNQPGNAISTAVGFAVFQGLFFKLGESFSKPKVEDGNYNKTRSMLHKLGLQNYEKNFKKGLLADPMLPLINDSALRDVGIPPGPRLLILDHIQRDSELKGKKRS